mmetsp:Transcript_11261/g.28494  ORF Transcript_11261/g.28494 Transcript_11261/m.28494 type:complete len:237 (+) Transcript_11261:191-901(+)
MFRRSTRLSSVVWLGKSRTIACPRPSKSTTSSPPPWQPTATAAAPADSDLLSSRPPRACSRPSTNSTTRSFSVALFLLPRPPLVTPTPHAATGSVVAAAAVEAVEATATGEEATAVAVEAMVEGETTALVGLTTTKLCVQTLNRSEDSLPAATKEETTMTGLPPGEGTTMKTETGLPPGEGTTMKTETGFPPGEGTTMKTETGQGMAEETETAAQLEGTILTDTKPTQEKIYDENE